MEEKQKEQWMQLCEQAACEENTEKLMALVHEINRLLDEKRQRLQAPVSAKDEQAKSGAIS